LKVFISLFVIALIILAVENQTYAQKNDYNWPIRYSAGSWYGIEYNWTPVCTGFIFLKNGDTLKGRIKLLVYTAPAVTHISFLPSGRNDAIHVIDIQRERINYVRLYSDTLRNGNNFTDFINLENKDLWRLVIEKDSVFIYDNYHPGDSEALGERMRLISKGKKIKIYGSSIFHTDGPSPLLFRFINRRYKEKCDISDFSDDNAMINYILTKEIERNRNNPDKY
jgi:hypothetical protein